MERYSQERMDAEQTSRTLSDAELLLGDAEIRGGQLFVTDEQLVTLAGLSETTEKSPLGVRMLLDETTAPVKAAEVAAQEAVNLDRMQAQVDAVVAPYIGIFSGKVPPAGVNRLASIRRPREKSIEWQDSAIAHNMLLRRVQTLHYEPGKEMNRATKASVRFEKNDTDPSISCPTLDIVLGTDGSSISQVTYGRAVSNREVSINLTAGTSLLRQLTGKGMVFYITGPALRFNLETAPYSLDISERASGFDTLQSTYMFDASSNEFRRKWHKDSSGIQLDEEQEIHRRLTVDQFATLLKETLGLLPSVEF